MDTRLRRRAPESTRLEIVETAVAVAAGCGAAAFTLDAVVARLSVSKGALLHHFPSKTALLEEMVDYLGRMFVEAVLTEAMQDPEPYGRHARAYLRVTINDAVTTEDVSIGRVILAACAIEPQLAERWRGWVRKVTAEDPQDPVGADDALMLRLVADGLWLSDIFGVHDISPAQRRALLSLLTPGQPIMGAAA